MIPSAASDIHKITEIVWNFIADREKQTDYIDAIMHKASGEFIGIVALHHLKSTMPELGIWTKLESHGNHYGREAIGGVICFAKSLGIQTLRYPVDPRNIPSKKIPIFYGGTLLTAAQEVKTPDGRILEEEVYLIQV